MADNSVQHLINNIESISSLENIPNHIMGNSIEILSVDSIGIDIFTSTPIIGVTSFINIPDNVSIYDIEKISVPTYLELVDDTIAFTLDPINSEETVPFDLTLIGGSVIISPDGILSNEIIATDLSVSIQDPTSYYGWVTYDTPVSYWRFGETIGLTIAVDEIGSIDGTYSGSLILEQTSLIASETDTSVTLGSNSLISDVGTVSDFNFIHETGIFSIETTIQPITINSDNAFIGNTAGGAANGFYFGFNTFGQLVFYVNGGNVISSYSPVDTIIGTNIYHLVVTSDGTNIIFYVNGVSVGGSGTWGTKPSGDAVYTVNIGASNGSTGNINHFDGSMDDMSVYNYTLSQTQVTNHFNTTGL